MCTGGWYASRLREQARQNVPGHQSIRRLKSILQRNAQTQQTCITRSDLPLLWCFRTILLYIWTNYYLCLDTTADSVNIKILNAGAWSRTSEKVSVSLPTELEDLIPEVEEFYKKNHSGRKLHWHHLMSNGIVSSSFSSLYNSMLYFLENRGDPKPASSHWD